MSVVTKVRKHHFYQLSCLDPGFACFPGTESIVSLLLRWSKLESPVSCLRRVGKWGFCITTPLIRADCIETLALDGFSNRILFPTSIRFCSLPSLLSARPLPSRPRSQAQAQPLTHSCHSSSYIRLFALTYHDNMFLTTNQQT